MNMENEIRKADYTLNSWKEIATYLERGVRTVQRWECELQLPVHRIRDTKRSPVFAFREELRLWIESRAAGEHRPENGASRQPIGKRTQTHSAIIRRTQDLTRELARLVIQHCGQTEALCRNLKSTLSARPGWPKPGIAARPELGGGLQAL